MQEEGRRNQSLPIAFRVCVAERLRERGIHGMIPARGQKGSVGLFPNQFTDNPE